jgi:Effector-associated domain 7
MAEEANELNAHDINTQGDVVVGKKEVHYHYNQTQAEPKPVGAEPASSAQKLYSLLAGQWFDLNDLEDLCFKLGIDWDSLAGDAKAGKARALVRECEKHEWLPRLQSQMLLARPHLRDQLS